MILSRLSQVEILGVFCVNLMEIVTSIGKCKKCKEKKCDYAVLLLKNPRMKRIISFICECGSHKDLKEAKIKRLMSLEL